MKSSTNNNKIEKFIYILNKKIILFHNLDDQMKTLSFFVNYKIKYYQQYRIYYLRLNNLENDQKLTLLFMYFLNCT